MPRKSINPTPTASKTAHVVPDWSKKVKGYREEAKKTLQEMLARKDLQAQTVEMKEAEKLVATL